MKAFFAGTAFVALLSISGVALAQVPSGGPDAKGNAPLKHAHMVNDGIAKPGHTSFTMKQAQQHIENAGYTEVTGLAKGEDGVWRGRATKAGMARDIGLDFKGNISDAGPSDRASTMPMSTSSAAAPMLMHSETATKTVKTISGDTPMPAKMTSHRSHHHRHGNAMSANCKNPGVNGVACSGIDQNKNGISDKEDRAIKSGAKP